MQAEVNDKIIELSEAGWLNNLDEWSEELAVEIGKNEKIPELTVVNGVKARLCAAVMK